MAMTRKHCEAIAHEFKVVADVLKSKTLWASTKAEKSEARYALKALELVARKQAVQLSAFVAGFDSERFISACGF
jgi:hypothetical protein